MDTNDNLKLYNSWSMPPKDAQKTIGGGRLSGMTDINPMWRIKVLTEQFGPCGIGWKYVIDKQWLEPGAGGVVSAFCNISLYIRTNGPDSPWSDPIIGVGGNSFISLERGTNLNTSDECYKMALTDALSVACKALGIGANIYWKEDKTKYTNPVDNTASKPKVSKTTPSKESLQMSDEMKQAIQKIVDLCGDKLAKSKDSAKDRDAIYELIATNNNGNKNVYKISDIATANTIMKIISEFEPQQ